MRLRILPALLPVLLCSLAPAQAQQATVTIYRCTDGGGRVMLRDTPCPRGQQQDAREMLRPTDAPSRPAPAAGRATAASAPATAVPQVLVLQAPRPMYECVAANGERYSSDSPEGNPRWVPLWTLGYPVARERQVWVPGSSRIEVRDGRVGGEFRSGHVVRDVRPTLAGYGAGTWVRDRCHPLPQAEACARLRDERSALRTRFFNAQPSERDRINVQERAINARLANDCGGA